MVELNYDNNAASVFGVTLLLFYLVPAVWYILHRVLTVGKQQKTDDVPDLGQARTKAEADKLRRIARSQKPDVLMTNSFKVFILVTSLLGLLFLFLLLRSSGQAELAQYDPYAVRKRDNADESVVRRRRWPPGNSPTSRASRLQGHRLAHSPPASRPRL
jgi:hypothetical protein